VAALGGGLGSEPPVVIDLRHLYRIRDNPVSFYGREGACVPTESPQCVLEVYLNLACKCKFVYEILAVSMHSMKELQLLGVFSPILPIGLVSVSTPLKFIPVTPYFGPIDARYEIDN